jgi:hypothetical protein
LEEEAEEEEEESEEEVAALVEFTVGAAVIWGVCEREC